MSQRRNAQDGVAKEQLIVEYVDGTLSPELAAQVRRHMESDATFREEVLIQQRVKELLAQYRPQAQLPRSAERRILGRLQLIGRSYHLWHEVLRAAAEDTAGDSTAQHIEVTALSVLVDYYLDGDLPEELREQFEQQLAIDEALRREVEQMRWLQEVALPACVQQNYEPAGHALRERVLRQLDSVALRSSNRSEQTSSWWRRAAAAAILPLRRYRPQMAIAAAASVLIASAAFFMLRSSPQAPETHSVDRPPGTAHTVPPQTGADAPFFEGFVSSGPETIPEGELEFLQLKETGQLWNGFGPIREQLAQMGHGALSRVTEIAASLPWPRFGTRREAAGAGSAESARAPASVGRYRLRNLSTLLNRHSASPRPAKERSEKNVEEELLAAAKHVGRTIAWEDDSGDLHCAVVVDAVQADETISLLCRRYDLQLTEMDDTDADSAGRLMVLELPAEKAEELINEMQERFQRLLTQRTAKNSAPGSAESKRTKAPQPEVVEHRARKRPADVDIAPTALNGVHAVTLPIRSDERNALLRLLAVLDQHVTRSARRALRRLPFGRPAPTRRRPPEEHSGTGKPSEEQQKKGSRRKSDRVVVYLYFVFEQPRDTNDERKTTPQPKR